MKDDRLGLILCCCCSLLFLLFPETAVTLVATATSYITRHFGSAFIQLSSLFLILSLVIAFSPIGRRRFGGVDATPEFSTTSWLSMLFAAGMGSGLVFWGVAEPTVHAAYPPAFIAAKDSGIDTGLALTYFHWGLHAWSIYAISGLVLGWVFFNLKRPLSIAATFTANSTQIKYRWLDFIAVTSIIFGVAGTLANSIALIQTGVQTALHISIGGTYFRIAILMLMAFIFSYSSILGLNRGIRILSNFNLLLMLGLLLSTLYLTDTVAVVLSFWNSTLSYIQLLPSLSIGVAPESEAWSQGWSVTYLIWWIAWAPFVGPFIAMISRGRRIRDFLLGVVFLPTLTSMVWFSTFGGGAFELSNFNDIAVATQQDYTAGLFAFFDALGFQKILSLTAIVLLITFVITSADSAILIAATLTGTVDKQSKIAWSAVLVAITIALLIHNNVDLNKQIAIFGAIPFTVILVIQLAVFLSAQIRSRN